MRLYADPISTTSRPILLLAAESGADVELQFVDLFKGENYAPAYTAINPNQCVPVLEDGDFRLTESSAILRYLADTHVSSAYPSAPHARARVDERLDWFNTGFNRDFCYNFIYPQIFSTMRRADDALQAGTIAHGRERALGWLKVLDENIIGPHHGYVCGDAISIADYLGSILLLSGECVACNFKAYPNITRWMSNMKAMKSWSSVNEVFSKYMIEPNRDKALTAL